MPACTAAVWHDASGASPSHHSVSSRLDSLFFPTSAGPLASAMRPVQSTQDNRPVGPRHGYRGGA
ncbi:uncharacterized protein SETTUDRAFT_168545 [Exserohilum turcica Et28A]|uniref:Uncharacterized protein n=1 Tax=Exserohilum turcicum (strain 28A) TaxID=671987 RepID=R0IU39_EXST2|nr:uncharacterized protein SETTUDRAFT_168545 [Exserohilum turcica Et28A]EOA88121.1 hypothetical protein SETTUDRAFT_168545 [Exserohilum turcica Et28A]